MTIRAFECVRTWDETPVTIFAKTLDEAERIYGEWACAHHEDQSPDLMMIYPFGEERLEVRPHLDRAASLGRPGVGYWDVSKGSWTIVAPHDDPAGDLAPPEGTVAFYLVQDEQGENDAQVFATSFEEATNLYCAYHTDCWGELPSKFTIHKRSRWELMGEQATLRDGLEAGVTGVAQSDNDGVWRILEPDWEPIYGRE